MLVAVGASALLLTVPDPAPAQTPEPQPEPAAVPRSAALRGVRLRAGEHIAFALHPTDVPITVTARSDIPLEVCPSTLDGDGPESGHSSWPSWTGFVGCIPFDDTSVQLPSTLSATVHLAFLVRATEGRAATIPRLTVTYTPGDGYFEVLPPRLAPGARTPAIAVTPTSSPTIGAQAYRLDFGAAAEVRTAVTQRGRRVAKTAAPPPGGDAQPFGPIRLDTPVRVVATNHGAETLTVRVAIAWV
jgi:hypothetical protein